jgi:hypothetical protein
VPLVETLSSGAWTIDGPAWPNPASTFSSTSYVDVACGGGVAASCVAGGATIADASPSMPFASTGTVTGLPTTIQPLPVHRIGPAGPVQVLLGAAACPSSATTCLLAGQEQVLATGATEPVVVSIPAG